MSNKNRVTLDLGLSDGGESLKLKTTKIVVCTEHGGTFDDNPGKDICKTCEDWLVEGKEEE